MSQHDCGLVWSARERWGMRGEVGVVGVVVDDEGGEGGDVDEEDEDEDDGDGEDEEPSSSPLRSQDSTRLFTAMPSPILSLLKLEILFSYQINHSSNQIKSNQTKHTISHQPPCNR